jgi:hypothetical protein
LVPEQLRSVQGPCSDLLLLSASILKGLKKRCPAGLVENPVCSCSFRMIASKLRWAVLGNA